MLAIHRLQLLKSQNMISFLQNANYEWNVCVIFRLLGLLHHTKVNRKGIPVDAILTATHTDN